MRGRLLAVHGDAGLGLRVGAAMAQAPTGDIVGRVVDSSGAVLPGVVVTVSGGALIQPLSATTGDTGTYLFPGLQPGDTYTVKFELTGFRTVVVERVAVRVGGNTTTNATLEVSALQETVTVSSEAPLVDTRKTGTKSNYTQEQLQNVPSARDPWVMLERTPGIAMDRANVGGSQSGQQSGYISRGATTTNNKWLLDGVDITDQAATGASAVYYDFDMLQEMQISTGGNDVTQQTGGVGINLVTKSGSDTFRGLGPLLLDRRLARLDQPHRGPARAGRAFGRADPEHQGLRHRGRRADLEEPRLVLGLVLEERHQGRRRQLLPEGAGLPGQRRRSARAVAVGRGDQRLPQHRPDGARHLQHQGQRAALLGQHLHLAQQLQQEGPQRPRRQRHASVRDHLHPGRAGVDPQGQRPSRASTIGGSPRRRTRTSPAASACSSRSPATARSSR